MRVAMIILVVLGLSAGVWAAEGSGAVLLLPFRAVGEGTAWLGTAVQQSLLSDLSRVQNLRPMVPATEPAAAMDDVEMVRKAGKAAGADYVVYGSYQLGEVGLRITGQVLDVNSGRLVGGIKATGTVRDLFAMEDTLGEQTKRILAAQTREVKQPAAKVEPAAAEGPVDLRRAPQPWDWDNQWIAEARSRGRYYDRNYYRGYWAYTYSYGPWYGGYSGSGYPGYWGYGGYWRWGACNRIGIVYQFPNGVIRVGN